ncbi:MAG: hypothetical protein GXP26_04280 [Planctomycetes bacterium]|nr:hypothetical protein [Planctomycetota bacterium]
MSKETFDALAERKHATHPITRQIIDRECHVGLSNRAVFKLVISRLVEGYKTYRSMPRESRRKFLQECIDIHRYNRAEYQAVMYPSYE